MIAGVDELIRHAFDRRDTSGEYELTGGRRAVCPWLEVVAVTWSTTTSGVQREIELISGQKRQRPPVCNVQRIMNEAVLLHAGQHHRRLQGHRGDRRHGQTTVPADRV